MSSTSSTKGANGKVPANLSELIQLSEQQTVTIAFTAPWLGASEIIDVVFEKLADLDYPDHQFFHYNIENEKEISKFFQIKELPTLITLSRGKVIDRYTGVFSKKKILKRLGLY